MRKSLLLTFLFVCIFFGTKAQNLLTESFDATTYPPTGWTSVITNNPGGSSLASSFNWQRLAGGGGNAPAPATHSGAGMANFNSYWIYSGGTAELRTPVLNFNYATGYVQVSFWAYMYTGYSSTDQIDVYVNTTATATGGTLLGTIQPNYQSSGANGWVQYNYTVPASFNTATNYIIFKATSGYGYDMDIDDISIDHISPCTGAPVAGTVSAASTSLCYNGSTTLTATGATVGPGISYQWQSYNGSAWVNVTGGTGATTTAYTTPALAATTQYRLAVTCSTSTTTTYSSAVTVTVGSALTAPYSETFESITAANTLPSCMSATSLGSYVYTYTANQSSYNRTNHTPSGSKFASFQYGCNDYIFTPAMTLTAGQTYQFSFWYITDGLSGWTSLKAFYGTSNTAAAMTNQIGTTVSNATNTTYQQFTGTFTPTTTGVYYFAIYCQSTFNPWYLTVDDINVTLPCTGTPAAGTVSATSTSVCYGATSTLSAAGATSGPGITYQWQSYNGTAWVNVTGGAGATTTSYTTGSLAATTQYRMAITCATSAATTYSSPLTINVANAVTPPYTETFESITANNSMPNCMSATSIAPYVYTYQAATGSYNQTNHTAGGSKYASFRYGANDYMFTPALNLTAGVTYNFSFWYITDGLGGWTTLSAKYGTTPTAAGMTNTLATVSNATNTTYQQFTSTFTPTTTGVYYMGIYCNATFAPWYLTVDDINVSVVPPCSGMPTPGTITGPTTTVCPSVNFTMNLGGQTTGVLGLTYQWQSSPAGAGTFTNISGATNTSYTGSIANNTDYRVQVTCSNTSQTASTPVFTVNRNPDPVPHPDTVCVGKTAKLWVGVQTGFTHKWYSDAAGSNTISSLDTITIANVQQDTVVYVSTIGAGGCATQPVLVRVKVVNPPVVNLGPDTTFCQNLPLILDAGTPGATYLWSTGATTQTYTPTTSGTYWVRVNKYCPSTDTINLQVDQLASVNGISSVNSGSLYYFTPAGPQFVDSYLWIFGDGTTDTSMSPTHMYAHNGVYTVKLVVFNRCGSDTAIRQFEATAVQNISNDKNMITMYPNPAREKMTIETVDDVRIVDYMVLNSLGQVVDRAEVNKYKTISLDVSNLPQGNYIIHINSSKGQVNKPFQVLR